MAAKSKHDTIARANAAAVSNVGTLTPPAGYVAPVQVVGHPPLNQSELHCSVIVANLNSRQ